MWNKKERQGTMDQVKGRAKQAVGALAGDDNLKTRGQVDEIAGKVEVAVGKMQRKTGDAVARVARAVKRSNAVVLVMAAASLAIGPARDAQGQTRILAPIISSAEPRSPQPSEAAQVLTIRGTTFLAGLSLSVTMPDGRLVNYSGAAIRARNETSFQVSMVLAAPGAYTLVATNPDRSTSDPFVLKVQLSAPLAEARPKVDSVLPELLTKDPRSQVLKINGERFALGLSVSLTDPIGTVYLLKGPVVGAVTTSSFELSVVLDTIGDYTLMVTNPSGESSNIVTLKVVMRHPPAR